MNIIKRLYSIVGVDGAISYILLSKITQLLGGVIILVFVNKYLSKVEQGYYYTFGSLASIQIFFELGLSSILTQFVAHENASLVWQEKIIVAGSSITRSRLSSLLRFAIKWFSIIAVLLFLGLLFIGIKFFHEFGGDYNVIDWQIPWFILSLTTALSFLLSPILAFFEGLGKVKEIYRLRFIQNSCQILLTVFFFVNGFKLWALPLAIFFSVLVLIFWLLSRRVKEVLLFVWFDFESDRVDYINEIFPLQWKIALSWISGYFIFQLFNPVLFATEGPEAAAKMGMTLLVLNAILSLSMSWINSKTPVLSNFISNREYQQLDFLFFKTWKQSISVNFTLNLVFLLGICLTRFLGLKYGSKYLGDQFLEFPPLLFMISSFFMNNVISGMAIYLRCHKREPLIYHSIITGILSGASIVILSRYFGVYGLTVGYMVLSMMSLIWAYKIFMFNRAKWHGKL